MSERIRNFQREVVPSYNETVLAEAGTNQVIRTLVGDVPLVVAHIPGYGSFASKILSAAGIREIENQALKPLGYPGFRDDVIRKVDSRYLILPGLPDVERSEAGFAMKGIASQLEGLGFRAYQREEMPGYDTTNSFMMLSANPTTGGLQFDEPERQELLNLYHKLKKM